MAHPPSLEQLLQLIHKRIHELAAWTNQESVPVTDGQFRPQGGAWQPYRVGDPWPSRAFPVTFQFTAEAPEAWRGGPVYLRARPGGEAVLLMNGQARFGLNRYHQEVVLTDGTGNAGPYQLTIEASPKGLFGAPVPSPRFEELSLLRPDLQVRALVEDLASAHDAARHLAQRERPDVATALAALLWESVNLCVLPRGDDQAFLARLMHSPAERDIIEGIWDEWQFTAPPAELQDTHRASLEAARQHLSDGLRRLLERHPAEGELHLTGHAHIDLAWLWPLHETKRKAQRTFSTVLDLMDRHDDFVFNQSSAQLYQWMEDEQPELFERLRARVQEGRWELVGGMWVEPDGNLINGESWVRQLYYGQRYFQSRFGRTATVCWLPDTFGYAANLPQLLRQAGLPSFFTTKLTWNETNEFPFDLYRWEGLDGSQVVAHSFRNPNQGYNGNILAHDLVDTWRNFKGKTHHPATLLSFGWGNGGGGPTDAMLERYRRYQTFPGLPRLQMSRVADHYAAIDASRLPVWRGEQYLELHRGTYTTQATVKQLNRQLEQQLVATEAALTLATRLLQRPYPHDALDTCWTTLLRNQFHDILPGSSVHEVNQTHHQEMQPALDQARALRHEALTALSAEVGGGQDAAGVVVIWNLGVSEQQLDVTFPPPALDDFHVTDLNGEVLPHAVTPGGVRLTADRQVPGLGHTSVRLQPGPNPLPALVATDTTIETRFLRLEVAPDGTLLRLHDRTQDREVLDGPGNQLWLYTDLPRTWEAWDVDALYTAQGQQLRATRPPRLIRCSAAEACIEVVYTHEQSVITQQYTLGAASRRLDIVTHVHWQGRRQLLRSLTPVQVRSPHATFETAFGVVTRSTHHNTSWDAAQFEVPAHRFADLSESDSGVSLLNDSKYGHSVKGNVLGLSLLRAPVYPDPLADQGEHHFTYSLYPHAGADLTGTLREAQQLNRPLDAVLAPGTGTWPAEQRLLTVTQPRLSLSALRLNRDEQVIVRLYDPLGSRGHFGVHSPLASQWQQTTLLEDGEADWTGRYGPFEVITLRG
ncbi:alpha-mannosidase [Deinococcus sonorensis]|uniref:Glycoside hydrolase family 38 C-terminal domain-containing protein n=2 Tax=Deinococcus sonorensis TaxID=309891 RepID=A0AAU7U4F6_9DEIO